MNADTNISDASRRQTLRNICRRPALVLTTAAVVATVVLIVCQFLPLKYTGTTVFERRVDAAAKELLGDRNSESFASQKLTLQNELMGRQALNKAVRQLRLESPAAAPTQAMEEYWQDVESTMADNLKINWRISSEQVDTISLSYTNPDPVLAAKVPNLLVQLYFNQVSEQIVSRLETSVDFLQQRRRQAEQARQEASVKRTDFLARHAQEYAEPGALQTRINQLTTDIRNYTPQLDLARQREAHLLSVLQTTSQPTTHPSQEWWGPNPERARLTEQLSKAQEALLDATRGQGMRPQHPIVIGLKKKIHDLEEALAKAPLTVKLQDVYQVGQQMIQQKLDLAAVQSEVQLYTSRLASAQDELERLQSRSAQYSRVSREYADLAKTEDDRREEVARWTARLGELQMQLNAEQSHRATIQTTIQQAKKSSVPSSPNLYLVLAGAALGGLAAGAALAALLGKLDHTIRTPEMAEEFFDLPIHGVIGEIVTARQRRARRVRKLIVRPLVAMALLAVVGAAGWMVTLRLQDQARYALLLKQPLPVIESMWQDDVIKPLRQRLGS